MRLILSRKGFDSSAGGCPSPIFPDGSLYTLPIPDPKSTVRYGDLHHAGFDIGGLVEDLTRGTYSPDHTAHLDPDMHVDALPRLPGWTPLLGQTGAAQGHLRKQGVVEGDLLLFFGLFRKVEKVNGHWRFVRSAPPQHILWGWLSIGHIVAVDTLSDGALPWARYHPHFQVGPDAANTLYIASDRLALDNRKSALPGAGIFPELKPELVLTRPESSRPSAWRLPHFFYPQAGRAPLSYHTRMERWQEASAGGDSEFCNLQCAARGQEFVLDTGEYPQVIPWLRQLIGNSARPPRPDERQR